MLLNELRTLCADLGATTIFSSNTHKVVIRDKGAELILDVVIIGGTWRITNLPPIGKINIRNMEFSTTFFDLINGLYPNESLSEEDLEIKGWLLGQLYNLGVDDLDPFEFGDFFDNNIHFPKTEELDDDDYVW